MRTGLAVCCHGSEYTSGEWAYGVNQVAQRLGELLGAGFARLPAGVSPVIP